MKSALVLLACVGLAAAAPPAASEVAKPAVRERARTKASAAAAALVQEDSEEQHLVNGHAEEWQNLEVRLGLAQRARRDASVISVLETIVDQDVAAPGGKGAGDQKHRVKEPATSAKAAKLAQVAKPEVHMKAAAVQKRSDVQAVRADANNAAAVDDAELRKDVEQAEAGAKEVDQEVEQPEVHPKAAVLQKKTDVHKKKGESEDALTIDGPGLAADVEAAEAEINEDQATSRSAGWAAQMAMDTEAQAAELLHHNELLHQNVRSEREQPEVGELQKEVAKAQAASEAAQANSRAAEWSAKMAVNTANKAWAWRDDVAAAEASARNASAGASRAEAESQRLEQEMRDLAAGGAAKDDRSGNSANFGGAFFKVRAQEEARLMKDQQALEAREASNERAIARVAANQSGAEDLKQMERNWRSAKASLAAVEGRANRLESEEGDLAARLVGLGDRAGALGRGAARLAARQADLGAGELATNASMRLVVSLAKSEQKEGNAQRSTLVSVMRSLDALTKTTSELGHKAVAAAAARSALQKQVNEAALQVEALKGGGAGAVMGVDRITAQLQAVGAEGDAVQATLTAMGKTNDALWRREKLLKDREESTGTKTEELSELEDIMEKRQEVLSREQEQTKAVIDSDRKKLVILAAAVSAVFVVALCIFVVAPVIRLGPKMAARDCCDLPF